MWREYYILLIIIFIQKINYTNQIEKTSEQTFYSLTDPSKYDRWSRPHSNGPTNVTVFIYVYFLDTIDPQNLHLTAHLLIRYKWKDERLARDAEYNIQGEESAKDRMWTPHLYIVNEQEAQIMGAGQQDLLVTIQPDGTVFYSIRMKVTLLCLMKLQKFPFDEQHCPLILESWSHNSSEIILKWETNVPVLVNSELHMSEYSLESMWTNSTYVVYSLPEEMLLEKCNNFQYFGKFAGNYSCLTVNFKLKRLVGHYIMDYYVPSILLVVVSWVTFWLDPSAVPGRTTLGTSTMLTFITLTRNTGSSLPKVSYIKATEIWFMACTAFIFGSLVEFAFVNTIWRRRNVVQLKKVNSKHVLRATLTPQFKRRDENSVHSIPTIQTPLSNSQNTSNTFLSVDALNIDNNNGVDVIPHSVMNKPRSCSIFMMTPQQVAQWIDMKSRVIFPAAFFIFNCFYWVFLYI